MMAAAIMLMGCGVAVQAADPGAGSAQDLSGVWWSSTPLLLKAQDNGMTLTDTGKQLYERTKVVTRAVAAGPKNKRDMARCESFGVPRTWLQPFPVKIVQKGDLITILYEHNRVFRLIKMGASLPTLDTADPAYMGHSVGRWEGNDLVIESSVFKEKTVLDDTGLPHSEQLRVTERLSKSSDGKSLNIALTINDPTIYAKPWRAQLSIPRAARGIELEEYICGWGEFDTRQTRARGAPRT